MEKYNEQAIMCVHEVIWFMGITVVDHHHPNSFVSWECSSKENG